MPRLLRPLLLLALAAPGPVFCQEAPPPAHYIDDEKFARALEQAILKLAEEGKAAKGKELLKQMNRKSCDVIPAPPSAPVLAPDEIYAGCSGGVVAITSAWKAESGDGWEAGDPATAWVLSPDGILVTNHHVFAEAEKDEVFGIMTRNGAFYPVTEILAADKLNDVAVFRVPAKGLQPLALAADEPVGRKVCVISHPDQQFYTFTQGLISRYTLQYDDPRAQPVKYMCTTADFARGSSGGPVLNDHGAVIGMVCSTRTTYYGEKGKDPDDDVQMIVKFCVPGESIRAVLKSTPALPPASPDKTAPPKPEAKPESTAEVPKARPVPEPGAPHPATEDPAPAGSVPPGQSP